MGSRSGCSFAVIALVALVAGMARASAGDLEGAATDAGAAALARGDAAYARRGEGQVDGRAAVGPIAEAVAAYEEAAQAAPTSLEARWKLLRALFFEAEYAAPDGAVRLPILTHGVDVGRKAEALLAGSIGRVTLFGDGPSSDVVAALRGNPDAAPICFWSAVVHASWGRLAGPMAALREGLVDRLRREAELVIDLDPAYEAGGAYRLLGRIHAEVPRIPFFTPWIHRDRALAELKRAFALAPDHPWNQLLLGMTLLELSPAERPRALELLQRVAAAPARPDFVVEDAGIERMARRLLAGASGTDASPAQTSPWP